MATFNPHVFVRPQDPQPGVVATPIEVGEIETGALQMTIFRLQQAIREERIRGESCLRGVAAPQMGILRSVIVFDGNPKEIPMERRFLTTLFNVKIIGRSRNTRLENEGCSCINNGRGGVVKRSESITFQALDIKGAPIEGSCDGSLASLMQHLVDHLEGKLVSDIDAKGDQHG